MANGELDNEEEDGDQLSSDGNESSEYDGEVDTGVDGFATPRSKATRKRKSGVRQPFYHHWTISYRFLSPNAPCAILRLVSMLSGCSTGCLSDATNPVPTVPTLYPLYQPCTHCTNPVPTVWLLVGCYQP